MDIVRLPLRALGLCRALGHSPSTPVLPAENPAQNSFGSPTNSSYFDSWKVHSG